MTLVIDASAVLGLALPDETNRTAQRVLDQVHRIGAIVPVIWWYEVRNVLMKHEQQRRLVPGQTSAFLSRLRSLNIALDPDPLSETVVEMARQHMLSVYDAAYFELAVRHGLPLATLDTGITSAARRAGVELFLDSEQGTP